MRAGMPAAGDYYDVDEFLAGVKLVHPVAAECMNTSVPLCACAVLIQLSDLGGPRTGS